MHRLIVLPSSRHELNSGPLTPLYIIPTQHVIDILKQNQASLPICLQEATSISQKSSSTLMAILHKLGGTFEASGEL